MVVSPTAYRLFQTSPIICASCVRHARIRGLRLQGSITQKRPITQNWLRKTAEAKEAWDRQAKEIEGGRKQSMLSILEERGYVNAVAGNRDNLDSLMTQKRIGAYLGIDPTAPSLHVGHLVPLMSLFWMYVNGFHTVTLLGGATARIGDPSGRTASRESQDSTVRKANMASMHYQLKRLWVNVEQYAIKYGYRWEWAWHRELANNNAWLNKLEFAEVLRLLGSGVRIGTMLGRDNVKTRMENGDGMSFAEFSYPILQSWDWWHMYHTKRVQVQIGGSDQYGNIIAGMDAINYINKNHYDPIHRQEKEEFLMKPMGFTTTLLTTASGEKFGKSAGNAIWLDNDMTSAFELYQFFIRSADADVGRYLKLFTFMPISDIKSLMVEHKKQPSKRIAQVKMASEVVEIIHGLKILREVEAQHTLLFRPTAISNPLEARDVQETGAEAEGSSDVSASKTAKPTDISSSLNIHAMQTTAANAPSQNAILPKSLVYNQPIARVLFSAGLVTSKSEGHRLCAKRGAYIGSRPSASGTMSDHLDFSPCMNWKPQETQKYIIGDDLLILRVGKWKVKIIKIISDEEFEEKGLTAPGWKEEDTQPLDNEARFLKPWHDKNYVQKAPLHQRGADPLS